MVQKNPYFTQLLRHNWRFPSQANKKTRNRAYDLLVKIGHACGDEAQGGKKENLQLFFNTVLNFYT